MRSIVTVAVVTALAGCATTPPDQDPVQIKLNDLDSRVGRIERVVSNQSLVQLSQGLDDARADVRRLRGQVEELQNSNDQLKKQLAGISIIGGRSAAAAGAGSLGGQALPGAAGSGSLGAAGPTDAGAVGGAGSDASAGGSAGSAGSAGLVGADAANAAVAAGTAGTSGAGGTAGSAPPSSVEQAVYNQSFDALKAGSYSVAITSFKDFLTNYPASPLAENAQYWLGEAYYVTRSYDDASNSFRTVLVKWPNSRKAPDAMLKLGFTQYELKKFPEARKTLQDVTLKYPDSDAARLAQERIKRIPAK